MKDEKLLKLLNEKHEFLRKIVNSVQEISDNHVQNTNNLAEKLTTVNTKMIDILASEKKLEPQITQQFLDILSSNNDVITHSLEIQIDLEKSRIKFYKCLAEIEKLYAKAIIKEK